MIFDEKKFDRFICDLAETRNINWCVANVIREDLKTGNLSFLTEEPVNLEYNRKVKVPGNVARWIEYCKAHGYSLKMALEYPTPDKNYQEAAKQWILSNESIFAQAWLSENYEVEEEPKYYVEIGFGKRVYKSCLKNPTFPHLILKKNETDSDWYSELTEKEIKEIDERYWPFAIPVEKEVFE